MEDAADIIPDDVVGQIGEEGVKELVTSFISAFVRAEKPTRGC
jgi:hypothetical protein